MLGVGLAISRSLSLLDVIPAGPVELQPLQFTGSEISVTAPIGTVAVTLTGKTPGSTLSIVADGSAGLFDLEGETIVVVTSLAGSTGSFPLTIEEVLAGAVNSPLSTEVQITILAIGLNILTLDTLTIPSDATVVGLIGNVTPGSTVEVTMGSEYFSVVEDGGLYTLTVTGDLSAVTGPTPVQLTETSPYTPDAQATDFEIDVQPV